jgi:hypothetical protein
MAGSNGDWGLGFSPEHARKLVRGRKRPFKEYQECYNKVRCEAEEKFNRLDPADKRQYRDIFDEFMGLDEKEFQEISKEYYSMYGKFKLFERSDLSESGIATMVALALHLKNELGGKYRWKTPEIFKNHQESFKNVIKEFDGTINLCEKGFNEYLKGLSARFSKEFSGLRTKLLRERWEPRFKNWRDYHTNLCEAFDSYNKGELPADRAVAIVSSAKERLDDIKDKYAEFTEEYYVRCGKLSIGGTSHGPR